jgi:FKBP-type peptidyl-prolyl cis-trans isomerase FkpA
MKLASSLLLALSGILSTSVFAQGTSTVAAQPAASAASTPSSTTPAPLHITKLGITDTVEGTGDAVVNGSQVEVHYTGWIYNHKAWNLKGAQFDTSRDSGTPLPVTVGARQVIRGWDMGLLGMKVGGKRTLMIPAYLAYSTQGSGNIPPNTHLVFEVELVSLKK